MRENLTHGLVYEAEPTQLRGTGTRKGFTLIELLVVIAIIMLLAALLLPALKQARGSAKSAACVSNLRQIGVSIQMYLDDNGSNLPVTCPGPFWGLVGIFPDGIRYLPNQWRVRHNVFACPAEDTYYYGGWGPGCLSYAYNGFFGCGAPYRATAIKEPTTMPFLACAAHWPGWTPDVCAYYMFRGDGNPWVTIGQNHRGEANFVFMDWHVEWYPRARWPQASGGVIYPWFPWMQ